MKLRNAMENTSDLNSELMDSDRNVECGSLNELVTVEECSNELVTVEECGDTSENERTADPPAEGLPIKVVASEPYVGMEFESADGAREYYDVYGRRNGFTIRVNRKRRSRVDREVIGFDYVCSKEGFRRKRRLREDATIRLSKQTRVGCKAMLVIAYRRDMEKWVVTNFLREHNHELMVPSEVPVRTVGPLNEDEKDKKIRELTTKLYNERQRFQRQCAAYEERCAAYRVQIGKILNDIETHNDHLTRKVDNIVQSIKEVEVEDSQRMKDQAT